MRQQKIKKMDTTELMEGISKYLKNILENMELDQNKGLPLINTKWIFKVNDTDYSYFASR